MVTPTLRTGIVGMGIRGTMYAEAIRHHPGLEVVAVVEKDAQRCRETARNLQVPGYETINELLDSHAPELVILCLPDHLHRQAVELAAQRGSHLLIEKPLATSVRDADAMVEAIESAGVKAMVAFENRWSPVFGAARDAVDAGELGGIELVRGCLNDSIWVPTRMLSWAAHSSPGWFLFPHSVDMALWLSGKRVKNVVARGRSGVLAGMGIETLDSISALLEFEDGGHADLSSCWTYPESLPLVYDFRMDLVGSKGAIQIDLRDQMIHKLTDRYSHPPTLGRPIHGKPVGFAAEMLYSFADAIRQDREPLVSLDEALYGVRVVDAIHRSVESGQVEEVG